jgi:hypothetical protein
MAAARWRWIAACFVAALMALVGLGSMSGVAPALRGGTTAEQETPLRLSGAEPSASHSIEHELQYGSDGVPIAPRDPSVRVDGPVHPHPITPAHERIYRENNLVGALNLAVDLKDAPRIRELVAQYRAEYPEDDHRLQGGYAIIADCLDQPGEQTRARAQHFWETEIRSQTRRYVRRHCLER